MSLQSWKEEFYPIGAEIASRDNAILHSLNKWKGLRKDNLERHDLKCINRRIVDLQDNTMYVDSSSCVLCTWYLDHDNECMSCPLLIVRGNVRCDNARSNETHSPYWEFVCSGDPEPMIKWLEKALETEKKE